MENNPTLRQFQSPETSIIGLTITDRRSFKGLFSGYKPHNENCCGMTANDAEELRQILLEIVTIHEARLGRQDEFGQRYTLDFTIEWQNRSATLRVAPRAIHGVVFSTSIT